MPLLQLRQSHGKLRLSFSAPQQSLIVGALRFGIEEGGLLHRCKEDRLSLLAAQTCVDESSFKEQVVYVGQPGPSYKLSCPLELSQGQSPAKLNLTWQKNCQPLLAQEGKAYLEFSSLSFEDQGNYTCTQQGSSTASFTVHLIVKGKYYFNE